MSSKKIVLVTGVSGFIGSHVVEHLLLEGYAVRGTSRSGKADQLRKSYTTPDFHVTIIDDLIKGDFSAALNGVHAVIHLASPVSRGTNYIEVAVEGTLNILRQAYAAKVYKVTVMSSATALFSNWPDMLDASRIFDENDWNLTTKEEALQPGVSPFVVYPASKALAERAAWEFAEAHPELELVTLLPPYVFGPLAPLHIVKDTTMLSTDGYVYSLISKENAAYPATAVPQYVDVRDVARASVLSLKAKPAQPGERRRILLWGGSFTWKQAVKHIAVVKPEIKGRLVDHGEVDAAVDLPAAKLDVSKAKEVLGLTGFINWQKSVEDAIDSLVKREGEWLNV